MEEGHRDGIHVFRAAGGGVWGVGVMGGGVTLTQIPPISLDAAFKDSVICSS